MPRLAKLTIGQGSMRFFSAHILDQDIKIFSELYSCRRNGSLEVRLGEEMAVDKNSDSNKWIRSKICPFFLVNYSNIDYTDGAILLYCISE